MNFPAPGCYYCGDTPIGEFVVLIGPGPRPPKTWTLLYLCQQHHDILADAGEHGRRYREYPERYWLSSREAVGWWGG